MSDFKTDIMRDEFRGDFTRDTFHPEKTFSRVLMQQGRVQIDADWNEQVSIQLHYLRNLARDIGGEHWGPFQGKGFEISSVVAEDFKIGKGHYYVLGILCEADAEFTYKIQPNYSPTNEENLKNFLRQSFLVYIDVWERHISYVEDDSVREIALGGPDTASRAKIIWQVKIFPTTRQIAAAGNNLKTDYLAFLDVIKDLTKPGTGGLQAKAKDKSKTDTEPCLVSPDSKYRGAENQLYRVEIHNGTDGGNKPTFKWSRENGSVIYPILERVDSDESTTLTLEHLGRDDRFCLKPDDWVEIVDDDYILHGRVENLVQILVIDHEDMKVTLKTKAPEFKREKHPYLRRWDQKTGNGEGIEVLKSADDQDPWIDLEDGIQIKFSQLQNEAYQSGDYWLIPARVLTGDIEWPKEDNGNPKALLPHGVKHHYAPLALVDSGKVVADLRRLMEKNWA